RLSSTPAAHVIDLAQASTTDCPGTAVAPEAAPGVLCVYVADRQGASKITILQAGDETFANGIDRTFTDATDVARATSGNISRVGAHVLGSATGASSVVSVRATWPVTAPWRPAAPRGGHDHRHGWRTLTPCSPPTSARPRSRPPGPPRPAIP